MNKNMNKNINKNMHKNMNKILNNNKMIQKHAVSEGTKSVTVYLAILQNPDGTYQVHYYINNTLAAQYFIEMCIINNYI